MEKLLIAVLEAKKLITSQEAEQLVEALTSGIFPSKYEHALDIVRKAIAK